jgi:hypothetical protein
MTIPEQAAQTPMSDHVARFWQLLSEGKVRILIDIHRPDSFGGLGHWDSSSFPDDVANALVAERQSLVGVEREDDLAAKIAEKLAEPVFVEMKERLDANINWPRYLPVQKVSPTAVSDWIVRLPSGREIHLTDAEWSAALPAQSGSGVQCREDDVHERETPVVKPMGRADDAAR